MLLVTHDRALLDAVAERTAAIEDGAINVYDGGWADYQERRTEPAPAPKEEKPRRPQASQPGPKKERKPLDLIESEIAEQEQLIAKLEAELADDWGDVDRIATHRRARADLHALLERWEALVDEVPS